MRSKFHFKGVFLGYEINEVADHAGEYINPRHIELLCDVMTSTGELYGSLVQMSI